jgi:hypothetical protein
MATQKVLPFSHHKIRVLDLLRLDRGEGCEPAETTTDHLLSLNFPLLRFLG